MSTDMSTHETASMPRPRSRPNRRAAEDSEQPKEVAPCKPDPAPCPKGDGAFVIEFGCVCYQDMYLMYHAHASHMYLACILMCILHVYCMYLDVYRSFTSRYIKIHQDTSRYIKIHQDTSRYICICHFGLAGNASYLEICILL